MKEFEVIGESLLWMRACTSLSDEVAQTRVPFAGTSQGWTLAPQYGRVPCEQRPGFYHIVFEC